jgi:hypothetical protein
LTGRRWVSAGLLSPKKIGRLYFVYGGDLLPGDLPSEEDDAE